MNANELNEWIDNSPYTEQEEVIVLLRQKQAEIEALKAEASPYKSITNTKIELTNEEIRKVINEIVDGVTVSEMVTFLAISKAILRKAQEK